jgi:PHD/YefM family antitoxin component YafN of YafNO toxin-antitoxin module
VRNSKAHVARIRQTRTPEVLTINGHAEIVVLDTETYENLLERVRTSDTIASLRAHMDQARKCRKKIGPDPEPDPIPEHEARRRREVLSELIAESERLGLYE